MKSPTLVCICSSLAAFFNSGPAMALPSFMVEKTYYSDDSKTEEVGFEVRPCCAASCPPLQGKRTRYVDKVRSKCDMGSGPGRKYCIVDGVLTFCPPNICVWYSCNALPGNCWFERPDCYINTPLNHSFEQQGELVPLEADPEIAGR